MGHYVFRDDPDLALQRHPPCTFSIRLGQVTQSVVGKKFGFRGESRSLAHDSTTGIAVARPSKRVRNRAEKESQ
jgi:hypothetical protein